MQRQPFAGVETNDETPLLPTNLIALDLEAWAGRLRNLQWLNVGPLIRHAIGGIVAGVWRQRPVSMFFHADDLHGVEIDDRPQPLHRPGVAILTRVAAQKAQR